MWKNSSFTEFNASITEYLMYIAKGKKEKSLFFSKTDKGFDTIIIVTSADNRITNEGPY